MGFWSSLASAFTVPSASQITAAANGPAFTVDENSIDPAVFGLTSYVTPTSIAPRVDRRSALQVPAVKRARDLICGSIGQLPIDLIGPERQAARSRLLEQPEAGIPRSVTMTRLLEDMLLEKIAWWKIEEFGWHTFPVRVSRLNPRDVTVSEDDRRCPQGRPGCTGKVMVKGKHEHDENLIRFDSPNEGLLVAGARAIRTCLSLDAAAARYAEEPMPLGYFSPSEGADPDDEEDDEVITGILDNWKTARQTRATGYVPAALKYNPVQFTPEQMQLADSRQHAVLEIARLAGIDPEELGVSTTSRTYANHFDRRKNFLDFALGPYVTAVQERLSMNDVSPRGYYARFNLDAYLRTDTKSRYEAYKIGIEVGAIDKSEVRNLEDRPPLNTTQETPVAADQQQIASFADNEPEIRLDAPGAQAFEVDVEKRTIKGLAVPYGKVARSNGQNWQFSKGTIKYSDVSRVKMWVQHDRNQAVGVAYEIDDREDGLYTSFKIARGSEGDKALMLAEDGVLDGLSIGLGQGGKFSRRGEVNFAVEAPLMEVSLTPAPAFDDARVHAVAASADTEGITMKCTKCNVVHANGVTECAATDVAAFEASKGGQDFSAVTDAIKAGFAGLVNPQVAPREGVPAGASFGIKEELPYRFDGTAGAHSFSEDLRAMASGDGEAKQRLETFIDEAFAVTTTNAGALNPTQNRPELYVPNLTYTRPLYEMVSTGTITDKTAFTVPKFSSASGLVGDHTEGTEPTPGSFAATSQTVTPTALSGKIEINREVWDQGGSPQADGIIWGEMLNGYYEAIEAKIAARLNGLSLTEINLAGVEDDALVAALTDILAGLQFVRGGNRYTKFAADGQLFPKMVAAVDGGGRPLLPVLGPQNAQGQTGGGFDRVALGSQEVRAAWALGSAVSSNSYLFVPSSVWAWASPPKRFTFEYQVKSVDMAVWGYVATAVLRDTDVKRIDYTTADS